MLTSYQPFKTLPVLLIAFVIILGSIQLVTTKAYLSFEYSKSDFPGDFWGFDQTQRLAHAADNLQFITQNLPAANLIGQKHNDIPLYSSQEIKYLQNVQKVYQITWRIWQIALILVVLISFTLIFRKENRADMAFILQQSGSFTTGLVFIVAMLSLVAWQIWLVFFHQVFFAFGWWTFDISTTLLRLFPQKFWYDTTLTVSSISLIVGILVYCIGSHVSISNNGQTNRSEPA